MFLVAAVGCGSSSDKVDAAGVDAPVDAPRDTAAADTAGDAGAPDSGGGDVGPPVNLYVGCANLTGDIQYYTLQPETGALALRGTASAGSPVSFSALRGDKLYVNHRTEGKISTFSVAPSGLLTRLGSAPVPFDVGQPRQDAGADGGVDGGDGGAAIPALNPSTQTVEVDATGKFVLAANFEAHTVLVFRLNPDGTVGNMVSFQSSGLRAHHTLLSPNNKLVLAPYRDSHLIAVYLFDETTGALAPHTTPTVAVPGTMPGPRHLALHPNGRWLYSINETNGTVSLFTFDQTAGTLTPVDSVSSLPASYTGAMKNASEISIAPSGKFLYVSNRLDNVAEGNLGVFSISQTDGKLTSVEFQGSHGVTPRHFTLGGSSLVVGNQNSDNIAIFSVDAATGKLTFLRTRDVCQTPFFVRIIGP
jgi:6-phosphogluconolactonase (cycloisomerase 2 family)